MSEELRAKEALVESQTKLALAERLASADPGRAGLVAGVIAEQFRDEEARRAIRSTIERQAPRTKAWVKAHEAAKRCERAIERATRGLGWTGRRNRAVEIGLGAPIAIVVGTLVAGPEVGAFVQGAGSAVAAAVSTGITAIAGAAVTWSGTALWNDAPARREARIERLTGRQRVHERTKEALDGEPSRTMAPALEEARKDVRQAEHAAGLFERVRRGDEEAIEELATRPELGAEQANEVLLAATQAGYGSGAAAKWVGTLVGKGANPDAIARNCTGASHGRLLGALLEAGADSHAALHDGKVLERIRNGHDNVQEVGELRRVRPVPAGVSEAQMLASSPSLTREQASEVLVAVTESPKHDRIAGELMRRLAGRGADVAQAAQAARSRHRWFRCELAKLAGAPLAGDRAFVEAPAEPAGGIERVCDEYENRRLWWIESVERMHGGDPGPKEAERVRAAFGEQIRGMDPEERSRAASEVAGMGLKDQNPLLVLVAEPHLAQADVKRLVGGLNIDELGVEEGANGAILRAGAARREGRTPDDERARPPVIASDRASVAGLEEPALESLQVWSDARKGAEQERKQPRRGAEIG